MANEETLEQEAEPRDLRARAQKLYWESEQSVNSIAGELGLSKGRLYEMIHPIPANSPCPECGEERFYEHRTARERDDPTCPNCEAVEWEVETEVSGRGYLVPPLEGLAGDARALMAGLTLGLAAGLLLARVFRR